MERLCLPMSTEINALTHRIFKTLIEKMQESKLSQSTISGALSAFQAITSNRFVEQFEERGFEPFTFAIPKIKNEYKDIKALTEAQKVDVEQLIYTLRSSSDETDRNMFKAIFFERFLAMRPGDINCLKWKNIENDFGKMVLRYTPQKTKKTNKRSNITLGPRLVEMIKPFIGDPEEYVITRHPTSGNSKKHGFYSGRNSTLWRKINKWSRRHGIGDVSKASYLFRRQRITEAFNEGGFSASMAIGMNTPKIQMQHYVAQSDYVAN